MNTYTFDQCYSMLNVNPKTFRSWLQQAGIDPDQQVSRADRRIRFLTQEQLEQLARDHGRLLGSSSTQETASIAPTTFKLLADRVTRAEEELARVPALLQETSETIQQQLTQQQEDDREQQQVVSQRFTSTQQQLDTMQETMQTQQTVYQNLLQEMKASFLAGFEGLEQSVIQCQQQQAEMKTIQEGYQQQLDATAQALTKLVQRVNFVEMSLKQLKTGNDEIKAMIHDVQKRASNQEQQIQEFQLLLQEEAQKRERLEQLVLSLAQKENTAPATKKTVRGNGTKKSEE